jgi:hypothetical protein
MYQQPYMNQWGQYVPMDQQQPYNMMMGATGGI